MLFKRKRVISLGFILLAIVIPQWLGEFFPFSHFPMYSSFSDSSVLYYMTDGKHKPLFLCDSHAFSTYKLDKKIETRVDALDWHSNEEHQQLKKEVATQLLNEFGDGYSERGKTVVLFEKIVFLDKNNIFQETEQELARVIVK